MSWKSISGDTPEETRCREENRSANRELFWFLILILVVTCGAVLLAAILLGA